MAESWTDRRGVVTGPFNIEPWQPIETAPKDGRQILAFEVDLGICIAEWAYCDWYLDRDSQGGAGYNDVTLTHWMPLPEAPQ
jgi:Protein of unknown function (DUF551)